MVPQPNTIKQLIKINVRQLVPTVNSYRADLIINVNSAPLSAKAVKQKLITVPTLWDAQITFIITVPLKIVCLSVQWASMGILQIGHARVVMLDVKFVTVQVQKNAPSVKLTLFLIQMFPTIKLPTLMNAQQLVLLATMKKMLAKFVLLVMSLAQLVILLLQIVNLVEM